MKSSFGFKQCFLFLLENALGTKKIYRNTQTNKTDWSGMSKCRGVFQISHFISVYSHSYHACTWYPHHRSHHGLQGQMCLGNKAKTVRLRHISKPRQKINHDRHNHLKFPIGRFVVPRIIDLIQSKKQSSYLIKNFQVIENCLWKRWNY